MSYTDKEMQVSTHRRHISREKWKDYDECGLV